MSLPKTDMIKNTVIEMIRQLMAAVILSGVSSFWSVFSSTFIGVTFFTKFYMTQKYFLTNRRRKKNCAERHNQGDSSKKVDFEPILLMANHA